MKICWDNIEGLRLTKRGNLHHREKNLTYKLGVCEECEEDFISPRERRFCSNSCARTGKNNSWYGKTFSDEHKEKLSVAGTGRKHTEESKKKMSEVKKGYKPTEETKKKLRDSALKQFANGMPEETKEKLRISKLDYYRQSDLPKYDLYKEKLDWIEECRRNDEDSNILEVKCTYCGRWFIPNINSVNHRIQILNGNDNYKGGYRLYCSDGCKRACPIYRKSAYSLMKEDAVRAGRLNWLELNREIQPELRQLVLKRDDYKCVKCENIEELHCHHIYPVATDPLLSADIDNCITLCVECHKEVHKQDGCMYNELRECIE